MSRKPTAVQIDSDSEESDTANDNVAFDDDTDLPLPWPATSATTKPQATKAPALPNLGTRGALLEEIRPGQHTSGKSSAAPARQPTSSSAQQQQQPSSGPALGAQGLMDPSHPLFQQFAAANQAAGGGRAANVIDSSSAEMEKYKKWTCIYPIYIDAKRAYGTGQRRIAREKSVWWPRSQDILTAAASYRLPVLHEPQNSHPRDWENPGRVKVLWKDNGRLTNPAIPTKKKLFEMIAAQIQRTKPDQVPKLSLRATKDTDDVAPPAPAPAPVPASTPTPKTRGPTTTKSSGKSTTTTPHPNAKPKPIKRRRPLLPRPPLPLPPLQDRYSMYSPLIPSGALLEGWKIGTPATPAASGTPGAAGTPGGAVAGGAGGGGGKGKRKVIRIRA